jgi:hypothetical protein
MRAHQFGRPEALRFYDFYCAVSALPSNCGPEPKEGYGDEGGIRKPAGEIGNWQNFRFILVGVATAFVSAVIGFEPKQGTEGDPRLRLSLIIFALAGAAALSCYAGRGNAKIGAYLQVFHEPPTPDKKDTLGWEGRNQRFQGSQWNLLSLIIMAGWG